jgi:hypothetical protein
MAASRHKTEPITQSRHRRTKGLPRMVRVYHLLNQTLRDAFRRGSAGSNFRFAGNTPDPAGPLLKKNLPKIARAVNRPSPHLTKGIGRVARPLLPLLSMRRHLRGSSVTVLSLLTDSIRTSGSQSINKETFRRTPRDER